MHNLWDLSGVDSLEVAQLLFSEDVTYLAPFQSVETTLAGEDCSVLRLCDRNFRIRYSGPHLDLLEQKVLSLQRCVWIKQYDWLGALTFPGQAAPHTHQEPHRQSPSPTRGPTQSSGRPRPIQRHSYLALATQHQRKFNRRATCRSNRSR